LTAKLKIYQIKEGLISEIYRSYERVYKFDFDLESSLLAIFANTGLKIYSANKGIEKSGIYDMKCEFEYKEIKEIISLNFIRKSKMSFFLVCGTKCGKIYVINMKDYKIISSMNLLSQTAGFLSTMSYEEQSGNLVFGTNKGDIGLLKIDDPSSKIQIFHPPSPQIIEKQYNTNITKIWLDPINSIITYIQNLSFICSYDFLNSTAAVPKFAYFQASAELTSAQYIKELDNILICTSDCSKITFINPKTLEPIYSFDTLLPQYFFSFVKNISEYMIYNFRRKIY